MGLKLTRPGFPGRGRGVPVYVRHLYVIFSSTPLIYGCPVWTTNYLLPSLSLRACKSNIFKNEIKSVRGFSKAFAAGRKEMQAHCRLSEHKPLSHGKGGGGDFRGEGQCLSRRCLGRRSRCRSRGGGRAGPPGAPAAASSPLSPVCLFQSPPAVLPTSDPFLGTSSAFSLQPGEPSPPPPSSRRLRCGRVSPPLHVRSVGAERACACRGGGGRAGP